MLGNDEIETILGLRAVIATVYWAHASGIPNFVSNQTAAPTGRIPLGRGGSFSSETRVHCHTVYPRDIWRASRQTVAKDRTKKNEAVRPLPPDVVRPGSVPLATTKPRQRRPLTTGCRPVNGLEPEPIPPAPRVGCKGGGSFSTNPSEVNHVVA